MALISPAYTRDDLIAMIEQRDALVSALKETVDETVREREDYNGKHQAAVIEIERLRGAVAQIDTLATCSGVVDPAQHRNMLNNIYRIAREALKPETSRQ